MCRFIAYLGNPLILDELLFKPDNSLVKQSIHAKEMDEPLNGDGFGLGWYAQDIDSTPGVFKSVQPAWNDLNLEYLAAKIRSTCFFAHVRRATKGGISEYNCHPFHHHHLLFMHNGDVGGFQQIKRHMRHALSDDLYNWVKGQTDSEHFFALFLENMKKRKLHFNATNASKVLRETLHDVEKIKAKYGQDEVSRVNAVITDGKAMTACRYSSDDAALPATLYYAVGNHYEYHDGNCHIIPSKNENDNGVVLIVSERLNSYKAEWQEVPVNHILHVREDLSVLLEPIG